MYVLVMFEVLTILAENGLYMELLVLRTGSGIIVVEANPDQILVQDKFARFNGNFGHYHEDDDNVVIAAIAVESPPFDVNTGLTVEVKDYYYKRFVYPRSLSGDPFHLEERLFGQNYKGNYKENYIETYIEDEHPVTVSTNYFDRLFSTIKQSFQKIWNFFSQALEKSEENSLELSLETENDTYFDKEKRERLKFIKTFINKVQNQDEWELYLLDEQGIPYLLKDDVMSVSAGGSDSFVSEVYARKIEGYPDISYCPYTLKEKPSVYISHHISKEIINYLYHNFDWDVFPAVPRHIKDNILNDMLDSLAKKSRLPHTEVTEAVLNQMYVRYTRLGQKQEFLKMIADQAENYNHLRIDSGKKPFIEFFNEHVKNNKPILPSGHKFRV